MKKIIIQDPEILGGKPIIAGTRLSVEAILESLSGGMEIKDILKEYPFLKRKQVQAVVDYVARTFNKQNSSKGDNIIIEESAVRGEDKK